MGYEDGPKAIRCYDCHTHRVKVSRNFIFESGTSSEQYGEGTYGLPLEGESGDSMQQSATTTVLQPQTQSRSTTPETGDTNLLDTPSKKTKKPAQTPTLPTEYVDNPKQLNPTPLRRLTRPVQNHNYRKLNNPAARLDKQHDSQRAKLAIDGIDDESFQHYAFAISVGETQTTGDRSGS